MRRGSLGPIPLPFMPPWSALFYEQPDIRQMPVASSQDRAFEGLRQRQIAPSMGNGRSKPPVTAR
jgi:hypothetical protein